MKLGVSAFSLSLLLVIVQPLNAQPIVDSETVNACINEQSREADDRTTVGELRKHCRERYFNRVDKRNLLERAASRNPLAILPHKTSYLLPITYFSGNEKPYSKVLQGYHLDNIEATFQLSAKFIVAQDVFLDGFDVELAFTATSWWQAYNDELSSPFRETNYEPELLLTYKESWSIAGFEIENSSLSLSHQSNGKAGSLSRSWHRIIGRVTFVSKNYIWSPRVWWRIPEDDKEIINDVPLPAGDDNPKIEKYLGYGELVIDRKLAEGINVGVMLRNNLRGNNKGSITLNASFPLLKNFRGYVEYFNGYGESLIYYDQHISRFGVGVKLTDWL